MATKQSTSLDLALESGKIKIPVQIRDIGFGKRKPHWVTSNPQNRLIVGFWEGPKEEYSSKTARAILKKLAAELQESSNEYYQEIGTDISIMLHSQLMQLKTNNAAVSMYPIYFEADLKEIDFVQRLNKDDFETAIRFANQILKNASSPKNAAVKKETGRSWHYRSPERGPIQEDSIFKANQESRERILEAINRNQSYVNSYVPEIPIPVPTSSQEQINPVRGEVIELPKKEEISEAEPVLEATILDSAPVKKVGKRKKTKERKKAQRAVIEEAATAKEKEEVEEVDPIATEEIVDGIIEEEVNHETEVVVKPEEEPVQQEDIQQVVEPVIIPEVVATQQSSSTIATVSSSPTLSLKADRGDTAFEACFHIAMNLRKIMNADDAKGILELIFGSSSYAELKAVGGFFNKWDTNKPPIMSSYYSPYDFSSYKRITTRIFNKAVKEANSNG